LPEWILHREQHGTAHAGSGVDEGRARNRFHRKSADELPEIVDRDGFVMRRVRPGIADRFGIEVF
jgi:hypothetical protein